MAKTREKRSAIQQWLDRDLTAAAEADELPSAFEVDSALDQIASSLAAGRHPVLVGEPGVGKTAVVHELVRRLAAGDGPPELANRRVWQFSFGRCAATLKQTERLAQVIERLIESLLEKQGDVVPFFGDFHLANRYDLESQLTTLAYRFRGPILAEGERSECEAMFEMSPELGQHYVLLHLEEPPVERVARMLTLWSAEQARRFNKHYTAEALESALNLSHRFLTRGRLPRKVMDFLGQLGALSRNEQPVTGADVLNRFCASYRVPRPLVDPAVKLDLAEVEAGFRREVLGQPDAVNAVVRMIGLVKAGLSDVRRPLGAFLFVGPSGVGKTHVAQLLAEYLFGSRERLIRFNMADYQAEFAAAILFGNPQGYGTALRGTLTQRIMGCPFAVVLLDEFEKAHGTVRDRFLQLVDEGCFINAASEVVSCRSMIFIATSNAGAEVFRGHTFGFAGAVDPRARQLELDRALEHFFRFELLNRFDQVVHFYPLSREDIRTIALRELERLKSRSGLKQRGIEVEVDESVLDWLTAHGYDADYGARFLRRTIERHVTTALAEALVRHNPAAGTRVELTVRQNRVSVSIPSEPAPAPVARAAVAVPRGVGEQVRRFDWRGLAAEAERVLRSAEGPLEALRLKRAEYSRLLEQMNEPSFWERTDERRPVLDRFRELDVAIRMEERFSEAVERLKEFTSAQAESRGDLREFGAVLERAARSLREWQDRLDDEGPGAVWVVIGNVDPLQPARRWIEDLARMELAWCRRRLHLAAGVAAYEESEGGLRRVILDVEGPGAFVNLSMEAGIHRLHRHPGVDLRASTEVLPKGAAPADRWSGLLSCQRRIRGYLGVTPRFRGRLELKQRGLTLELVGEGEETLSHLLHDLEATWNKPPADQPEQVRVYNEDGSGARDPRTGAAMPHLKDVLRGHLDEFLEAWRRHRSGVKA